MGEFQIKSKLKLLKKHLGMGIVVALEGRSWRRTFFPYYKANRDLIKKEAEETENSFPFDLYFTATNGAIQILKEKYKSILFIQQQGAEGDDVVACSVNWAISINPSEPIAIVSSDKDFGQLPSTIQVKYGQGNKVIDKSSFAGLEHIIGGDAGDGIPNIFQPDDYFVNKQKYAGEKTQRLTQSIKSEIGALSESERENHPVFGKNYVRNRTLVMFDFIPEYVSKPIHEALYNRFGNIKSLDALERIRSAQKLAKFS